MNRKFILIVMLGLMLVDWCLFFMIFFYYPDLPPPGLVQQMMIYALMVLTFPLVFVVLLLQHDPGLFLTSGVLFLVSALVWAIALERLQYLFRRTRHGRPAAPAGSEEEFRKLLEEHRKTLPN